MGKNLLVIQLLIQLLKLISMEEMGLSPSYLKGTSLSWNFKKLKSVPIYTNSS